MSKAVAYQLNGKTVPEGWEVRVLGELLSFKNGINASRENYGSGVRFINVMEVIYNDSITIDMLPGSVTISEDQMKLYLVRNGDILFNRTSETGNEVGLASVFYGTENVVFGGFVIRGTPLTDEIDNAFKRYCFRSKFVRDQIIKGGQGAVRTNIGQGDLEKVSILLPPLPEQKAIAQLLSTWDEAIQKLTRVITQKQQRKKWLMQMLLTGKKRLKGFKGEWTEVHIKDIAEEVSIRNRTDKNLVVLSCTKHSGLVPSLEYFGRKIYADDLSTYKVVLRNHFAYATNHIEEGSIGYQAMYDEALISPMYTVFKTDINVNDDFFFVLLKSHYMISQYMSRMEGSIDRRGGLRWDAFSTIPIHLPPLPEQTAIANILQTADNEINLLQQKLNALKAQKKGLMQQLLTGKKRLKHG